MNRRKIIPILIGVFGIGNVLATPPWTQDAGKVSTFYAGADGRIAVMLVGNFPHALADGQCPASGGNIAGHLTPAPVLQAVLLAAKTSGQTVTITTAGCEGSWLKIVDVYLQ